MAENKENKVEEPKADNTVEKLKVKKPRKKKFEKVDNTVKVDLTKPVEKTEEEVTKVEIPQPKQEVVDVNVKEVVEENIEDNTVTEEVLEEVKQEDIAVNKTEELPESVDKLVKFMQETGGDLNDYINLNKDYDSYGDDDLLKTYYKDTKPHLNDEEINFLVQESFEWDENNDDEREVKRKKLALKEQVAQAKQHLDSVKSKYYEDIKLGSKLTEEQSKALRFFEESQKMREVNEQAKEAFMKKTNEVFNNDFKGFEYNVGDKVFRYRVNDAENVKNTQSDINNFVKKFLNKKNQMENASGYHKGLFTAMNSDAIAKHFYEQGKADALKESIAKSKNINMDPRQAHGQDIQSGGIKMRVLGNNSSGTAQFKFKKRK